jgi:quinol monooxygenase YgiN
MIAIWVKVRVKPDGRERFLKAIEVDALGSERDEPGCYRFNVLQDAQDPSVYYFYEVYEDQVADVLDGPTAPTRCTTVFPADKKYWTTKR